MTRKEERKRERDLNRRARQINERVRREMGGKSALGAILDSIANLVVSLIIIYMFGWFCASLGVVWAP